MDAVKFIEERNRMCATHSKCPDCPAFSSGDDVYICRFKNKNGTGAEVLVRIVEKWSAAHPRKTRQSVFLEQWPEADRDKYGTITICPKAIIGNEPYNGGSGCAWSCADCCREFWMQEVE